MNCKQGDLAWINDPQFVGGHLRFVLVSAPFGACERSIEPGHHWWVRPEGWWPPDVYNKGRGEFIFPDSLLRPIRPDSEPTSFESHRELEHA